MHQYVSIVHISSGMFRRSIPSEDPFKDFSRNYRNGAEAAYISSGHRAAASSGEPRHHGDRSFSPRSQAFENAVGFREAMADTLRAANRKPSRLRIDKDTFQFSAFA